MKRILWLVSSVVYAAFAILGILVFISSLSDTSLAIFSLIWAILFAVLFLISYSAAEKCKKKKAPAKKKTVSSKVEKPKEETVPEKEETTQITIPSSKDGIPLAYKYSKQEIAQLDYDVAMTAAHNNSWELSAAIENNEISLYSDGAKIGLLSGNHVDMMKDWIKNEEPYLIYLENINTEQKTAVASLFFYRDKRKSLSYREQTVVKLTRYSDEYAQLTIPFLTPGTELDISEEYDLDKDTEYVSISSGFEIGRLPKRISERYFDEGAAACFFDHYEDDPNSLKYIPFVVIYW